MTATRILHQNGAYWVAKFANLYHVMRDGITHAELIGGCGWEDISLAIAYCDYQARRAA